MLYVDAQTNVGFNGFIKLGMLQGFFQKSHAVFDPPAGWRKPSALESVFDAWLI
jgi:hypothetical protein